MPITVNEGGTLYELDTIYSNESGTLYKLDTVHSNEGGTLYEIYGGKQYPSELTWFYVDAPTKAPTISNNGLSVNNSNRGSSSITFSSVQSNNFEIRGTVNVGISFSRSSSYSGNSGGVQIHTADGTSVYSSSTTDTPIITTVTLSSGTYYILTGASGGGQSGSGANQFYLDLSFS